MPRSNAIPKPRLFMPDSNGGYTLWQDHFCADPASYEQTVKAVG